MPQKLIECPNDPTKKYFRDICATIFQNSDHRPWCRKCSYFQQAATVQPPSD